MSAGEGHGQASGPLRATSLAAVLQDPVDGGALGSEETGNLLEPWRERLKAQPADPWSSLQMESLRAFAHPL